MRDDDGIPRHRRRRGRKPYRLEARTIPGKFTWAGLDKWFSWGRYRTVRDRDEAFRALMKNMNHRIFEFRVGG